MPNQEMLDRMPEVSQNTLQEVLAATDRTLGEQMEGLKHKIIHQECGQRIAKLEGIVKRYAQHEPGCRAGEPARYLPSTPPHYPCNCGLSAVLAKARQA